MIVPGTDQRSQVAHSEDLITNYLAMIASSGRRKLPIPIGVGVEKSYVLDFDVTGRPPAIHD